MSAVPTNHFALCTVIASVLLVLHVSPELFAQQTSAESIYKTSVPSIMTLRVTKADGSLVQGTAFLVNDTGIAATAWYLVKDAREAVSRFFDGEQFESSGLIDKDEARDIALIRVKVSGRPGLSSSIVEPGIGSLAYVVGSPRGFEFAITDGLVSQVQLLDGVRYYQFSSPASPGNSGGPLLNQNGEVIGVVSMQIKDGQNLNFAVPSNYLLGLDRSLPTTPWASVRVSAKTSTAAAIEDEKADELLAKFFWTVYDVQSAVSFQVAIQGQKGGFQAGVDTWVYEAQRRVERGSLGEKLGLKPMDALHLPLRAFEMDLTNWRGKRVQFGIVRGGRPINLKGKIPKEFALLGH